MSRNEDDFSEQVDVLSEEEMALDSGADSQADEEELQEDEIEEEEEKRPSFEGEPIIVIEYNQSYDDAMEGLEYFDAIVRPRVQSKVIPLILTVATAGIGIWQLAQAGYLIGIGLLVLAAYYFYRMTVGQQHARNKLARRISAREDKYALSVYLDGISLNDGKDLTDIKHRLITMYRSQRLFMLRTAKMFVLVPVSAFGERLKETENFFKNLYGERYIELAPGEKPPRV